MVERIREAVTPQFQGVDEAADADTCHINRLRRMYLLTRVNGAAAFRTDTADVTRQVVATSGA